MLQFSSTSWMALQPLWALASFQFPDLFIYSLNEWSAHLPKRLDGKWPIILLRGPLPAWGSLTCSKFTTRVKQLKLPPGGLVPWIFPALKVRWPPSGLNPRRSSHEVGTLPLDYGGRSNSRVLQTNIEDYSQTLNNPSIKFFVAVNLFLHFKSVLEAVVSLRLK
jgi:hypothetical protein